MKRLATSAALALAGAACILSGEVETPDTTIPTLSNPLDDALTAAALAAPTLGEGTPAPASTAQAALPTPVTTSSIRETSASFGAVTVVTTSNTTLYWLDGETADDLDRTMRTFGPPDSVGNRWYALTKPGFDWDIACACDELGCTAGPVEVYVWIDYTLPTWEPPYGSDPDLVASWRYFESALAQHERGHGDLASACGQQLGEAFVALPAQPTCDAVRSAALEASSTVFAGCRAAQAEYEAETNHGQNDGVLWPP